MLRKGVPTWVACFIYSWLDRRALGQGHYYLLHGQLQASPTCSWELTATGNSSGPSEIRSALVEARQCADTDSNNITVVVSVHWEGSIHTEEPFVVPSGVELWITGDGWFSFYEETNRSSRDNGREDQEVDAELEAAIAAAATAVAEGQQLEPSVISSSNGTYSLFVVEPGGALHLSKIALAGAWVGTDGGGAVLSVGGEITGEDVWWKSLAAEGAAGAIFADDGANVTLKGLNLFQDCSSSLGGGALFIRNATCSIDNSAQVYFESCSAASDGGCVELSSSTLTISSNSKTRFRDCSAGDQGGGLYMKDSAIDVGETASLEFQGCSSGNVSGSKGGGICSYACTISVGAGSAVTFVNNSSPIEDGGGLFGQTTYVEVAGDGAALVFTENCSGDSGGGLKLEMLETDEEKDCLAVAEGSTAYFSRNEAVEYGGGASFLRCHVSISGNLSFRESIAERAGALYLDESGVLVHGDALFVENLADRWGGAVYLINSLYAEGNGLRFTGSMSCSGNAAERSGGCIYIVNGDVTIARDIGGKDEGEGGKVSWVGNTAGYDGGVIAVDGGSVWLEGGFASSNSATERGGILFGIGESTVIWQDGESRNNTAATGGSLYMSSSTANLTDLRLDADTTPSGANIFLAAADVRAVNVSMAASEDLKATFALHVDSGSTFRAFACGFDKWGGDSPVVVSAGALVMDVCYFSTSTAPNLVYASPIATIRNAILGDNNLAAEGFNASSLLGVGMHTCASIPRELSCTVPEECGDAEHGMGVLCPSFTEAATGGVFSLATADGASPSTLELIVATSAARVTASLSETQVVYYPELVTQELLLRHNAGAGVEDDPTEGAGDVLWELRRTDGGGGGGTEGGQSEDETGVFTGISPDNFTWTAVPSSGFLVRGQQVAIQLVGYPPLPLDPSTPFTVYNGEVSAEFQVVWWMEEPDSAVASSVVLVKSMFYYCREGFFWDGETCVSCVQQMATIPGGDGALNCSVPGVTLNTLPLSEGYWRGDTTRTNVLECHNPSACIGGRGMDTSSSSSSSSSSDASVPVSAGATTAATNKYDESRYCVEGHKGAYCSVCVDGYRRFSEQQLCISCAGGFSSSARGLLWGMVVAAAMLLITLAVFLVGGVKAISQLKRKLAGCCYFRRGCSKGAEAVSPVLEPMPTDSARRMARDAFVVRLVRAVPLQKLKILVVVWQILTQFSRLADIQYPPSYRRFLNFLDVVNFDITWPLIASCLIDGINFYQRLLAVTLGPLAALVFLGITYAMAMHMHPCGPGQTCSEARQSAVVRHASTGLLVLFLVFSSVSTTVFSTYACDFVEDLDVFLLRADYSISCDDPDHFFYASYAAVMILLYPIGIPVLFAAVLLKRRDKINPPLPTLVECDPSLSRTTFSDTAIETDRSNGDIVRPDTNHQRGSGDGGDFEASWADVGTKMTGAYAGDCSRRAVAESGEGKRGILFDGGGSSRRTGAECQSLREYDARRAAVESRVKAAMNREEVLENRISDHDLQSTRFLWEPYEPDKNYYETVECGRRCLLTGALVFVLPNTAAQAAGACLFAFVSLLAFELLRPHLSHTDAWMYRVGCIVIVSSNFLALMVKADVSDETASSQETFGLLLIVVHASMVLAIISQVYLSMQGASESRDDFLDFFTKKGEPRNSTALDTTNAAEGGSGFCSSEIRALAWGAVRE
ncbi:unnamed protein product, partial [Pylaiella littoralis]